MQTKRRTFLAKTSKSVAAMTALIVSGGKAVANTPQSAKIPGGFVHMVFFWLRNPENQDERQRFEKALYDFVGNTPGILSQHIGRPADTDRPVIDNSWTYSLVLSFQSKKEHDAYQAHPFHKRFIDDAGALWKEVRVYDSITQ